MAWSSTRMFFWCITLSFAILIFMTQRLNKTFIKESSIREISKTFLNGIANEDHGNIKDNSMSVCSQNQRKSLVQDMCDAYRSQSKPVHKLGARLVVDDKRKIAYCFTEKAACSTWKTIMANVSSGGQVKQGMTPAQLRGLHYNLKKKYGLSGMIYNRSVSTYTKFMVVRHPLERLVSAYRDKMKGGDVTFRKARDELIARFRENKTDTSIYPTFREFIQMVLSSGLMSWNPHWNNYFFKCDVCHVKYDYILKVETMEHDMKMFLSEVYADEMKYITENKLNSLKPTTEVSDNPYSQQLALFQELTTKDIEGLRFKFRYESDFYGYSFNQKTLSADCCDNRSVQNSSKQCCC